MGTKLLLRRNPSYFISNAGTSNYHLQVTSPCIVAGDPAVGGLTDKDSVTRGVAVDIGAYEYV